MKGLLGVILGAICIYIGASFDQGVAARATVFGGHADLLLVFLAVLSLWCNRAGGATLGFFAGLVYGELSGANLWQYCTTRALAGFIAAWANDVGLEPSVLTAAVSACVLTLFCQLTLMFLAPPPQLLPFLGDTIRTAVYNGVLAMPVYALLRRILGTPGK